MKRARKLSPVFDPKCFCCGKVFAGTNAPRFAYDEDNALQHVGPECYKKIVKAKEVGYQPPLGGPRMFDCMYRPEVKKALQHTINSLSLENDSDTPDFIIAEFLHAVLLAWGNAIKSRKAFSLAQGDL